MKKILALILAMVLCFSMVACAGSDDGGSKGAAEANPELLGYVKGAGEELLDEFETELDVLADLGFSLSLEVVGDGFVIRVNIGNSAGEKRDLEALLQDVYDELLEAFEALLDELQIDVDVLEYLLICMFAADGEELAEFEVGDTATAPETVEPVATSPEQLASQSTQPDTAPDAAGSEEAEPTEEEEAVVEPTESSSVLAYVEDYADVLLSAMESSFATTSGMTCTSGLEVIGNGIVITICINELEDVDAATKAMMQAAYDEAADAMDPYMDELRAEVPELEYMEIVVCEADGDELATLRID